MKIISLKPKPMLLTSQYIKKASFYLRRLPIYLGLVTVALVLIWLGIKTYRIYTTYRDLAPHLAYLQGLASSKPNSPEDFDLALIEESIHSTATGLEALSAELKPFLPLTPYLGWIPTYGGDIQAAPYLLAAGRDLSQAGVILFDHFSPLLESGAEMGQDGLLPAAVATLVQAEADIEQAEVLLRQAEANISPIEIEYLSPKMAHRAAQLKQYLPEAISGLLLAKSLPTLLGAESPQTYLVLTQNADEIRPSGGYINAAGHIIIDQGQIVEFVMQDSYAVDQLSMWDRDTADQLSETYPYPPQPIYQYMAADYWVLRDAGWSPDFPTTARTAIELYEMGQGISATGVIALDQQALAHLLRAFESVEVEGQRVTSQNVIKLMRQQWAPDEDKEFWEWWSQRKSFMLALAQTIRQRFEQDPSSIKLPVLVNSIQGALAEKHILVYLEDPAWTNFLAERNWAGSLSTVHGDYLMVVDANLGFNKASVIVERQLSYQTELAEDGSAQAQVNLGYRHPAKKQTEDCWQEPRYDPVYEQNMARCYWNYPRLIVPRGAQLVSGPSIVVEGQYLLRGQPTTGEIDVAPVGSDKISWGQLFLLPPQESIALDYVYSLPPDTAHFVEDHWEYSLYLQKQPGTLAPPIEVTITLPEEVQLLDSQPLPSSQQERVITYQLSLKTDQEINISYTIP
jgi:hypothetical protein